MTVRQTLLVLTIGTLPCFLGADWVQFRGPSGQGVASDARIAEKWSETENVVWRTEVEGRGWSSPLVVGNQVWITTAHETLASKEEAAKRLKENTGSQPLTVLSEVRIDAVCLDAETGKVLKTVEALRKKDRVRQEI